MATIMGTSGNDTLVGPGDGADSLFGLGGDDTLDGGRTKTSINPPSDSFGQDDLFGGPGDDVYFPSLYILRVGSTASPAYDPVHENPGEGIDTVVLLTMESPVFSLVRSGPASYALPADVENLVDGDASEGSNARVPWTNELAGNALDNTITGSGVAEGMFGGAGADVLLGRGGNDVLFGEDGDDLAIGGPGDDVLGGGPGSDVLGGDEGDDFLDGNAGDDRLYGHAGNDRIAAGGGTDLLAGGAGNDELGGEDGADALFGEDGDDRLYGGAGDDRLTGGAGADALVGGSGADTFVFAPGDGRDVVHDFAAEDRIALGGFASFEAVRAAMRQEGADTVIVVDAASSITLVGVHADGLGAGQFQFF